MVILPEHKAIFLKILNDNLDKVYFDKQISKWIHKTRKLDSVSNLDYLYVDDNRYFKTIAEVMLFVFDKRVPLSQGYFKINENERAWFPQPQNDNWENKLSDDGNYWYETPKTLNADYIADNCLRYVFEHTKQGYRFTGVFIPIGLGENKTRIYEKIADKVCLLSQRQRIVICRLAYMKYYNGITSEDIPQNGGSYVDENSDAFEKYNFHCYDDGNCYGFVETKYQRGHRAENEYAKSILLENIDPNAKEKESIDNILVVYVAFDSVKKKTVVVGWYDNATVYRNRIIEDDRVYIAKCDYLDAHLISCNNRTFEVPKANKEHFGIGQSNFWYIQKNPQAKEFENQLLKYINSMR